MEARELTLGFPPATGEGLGEVEGGRSDMAISNSQIRGKWMESVVWVARCTCKRGENGKRM